MGHQFDWRYYGKWLLLVVMIPLVIFALFFGRGRGRGGAWAGVTAALAGSLYILWLEYKKARAKHGYSPGKSLKLALRNVGGSWTSVLVPRRHKQKKGKSRPQ